jgi:serine/threonine protein kinase
MSLTDPLEHGAKLGPYTILERIGAGGMGEVYKANDPKLTRDVAIKVVRPEFLGASDRLARIQREARILASLNHPHIAAIYGLEDSGGAPALVMELVDGPTVADWLLSGPVPVEECLRIAIQIAEGLEFAHERGIVHRDLKPANVKVTAGGTVKILDFGLAKALAPEVGEHHANPSTISHLGTEAGIVLGTPAYMSPEQASGRPVDRRTDVWAFGCLFYEILTGTRAFSGETTTDTLAAVMRSEPDWSRLPRAIPAEIPNLLRRCLRKNPRQRLQAIGDARITIDEILSGTVGDSPSPPAVRPARRIGLEVIAGATLALLAGVAAWVLKPTPVVPHPVRAFTIPLRPEQQLASLDRGALALSSDGSQLAYVATPHPGATPQLYVRAMDTATTRAIGGTEGAAIPFFSPDGQWLGFFADGTLKKFR